MSIKTYWLVFIFFLLPIASKTWAQSLTTKKGLTTAVFQGKTNEIEVFLPGDLRPGEMISGTIVANPITKSPAKKGKNELNAGKNNINLGGTVFPLTSDSTLFKWRVPNNQASNIIILQFEEAGQGTMKVDLPFKIEGKTTLNLKGCQLPTHVLSGGPLRVTGPFDGDLTNTRCSLGQSHVPVLCESQTQAIVMLPGKLEGLQPFEVSEQENPLCSGSVSCVNMQVTTGDLDLKKGQNTFIQVKLSGLQTLSDNAWLTILNTTPGVVKMTHGDIQKIEITPPADSANGVFTLYCPAVGLASGEFSVTIDLDLPEKQPGYPFSPTQPEQNPEKPDSLEQPGESHDSTIAQCEGCKCQCSNQIFFEKKEGDTWVYRVAVNAACNGSFGNPPCVSCGIIDAINNEWTISFSADQPVKAEGDNKGVLFKFKNPTESPVSLSVISTTTCSDGTTCSSTANYTGRPPTVPVPNKPVGNCTCSADCAILKKGSECKASFFEASVQAECKPVNPKLPCTVAGIAYFWYIEEEGKNVAAIAGAAKNAGVKVLLHGAGTYTLCLKIIVTCTDGSTCESVCKKKEKVTECQVKEAWCPGPAIRVKAMGYYPNETRLIDMRPGEMIGLTVFGMDEDVLMQQSICNGITGKIPIGSVEDEITYTWEALGKEGKELKDHAHRLRTLTGSGNLYTLPWCHEEYPVLDEIAVTLANGTGKAADEVVTVIFTIELQVEVTGYNDELSVGQGNAIPLRSIRARVTASVFNRPADVSCTGEKPCCTPLLPLTWEMGGKLTPKNLTPGKTYAVDRFPDNMVILHAEATDTDDLTLECMDPLTGKAVKKEIKAIPDVVDYTWTVTSGNARLIYHKGPSVVLTHTYGSSNTVYVKCDISDSKTQFNDPDPEFYPVQVPPRKKPEAVVALGDITYSVVPLRHTELEELVVIAAGKYKKAGYEVQSYYTTNLTRAEGFFRNPGIQAVMLLGHAGGGEMVLSDKKDFGYMDVVSVAARKWPGCAKMHPTVKELQLLGCESHSDNWLDAFFRLDQYHSYRDKVWSTSFSSRIVDYINKYFKPSPPRIAPPE